MKNLPDFSKTKILVVGDVMLDRYWWGTVSRISPEAPVPIVHLEGRSLVAGGAANVAANLTGLGCSPLLFGVKGDDEDAVQIDKVLSNVGIRDHFVIPVKNRKTTIKTRIVAHSQHVVRIDNETTEMISSETAEKLLEKISSVINKCDAIIISDYAKGVVSDKLLQGLVTIAREKSKLLVVDPKSRDLSKYNGATIITPNKREVADASPLDPSTNNFVERAGKRLMEDLQIEGLLITEGEDGMTLFQRNKHPFHLDSWAREVFDVTGAGDTVVATFTAAAAAGYNFIDAAKLANLAAGFVVGKVGTTRITRENLADFLSVSEHGHLFETFHA